MKRTSLRFLFAPCLWTLATGSAPLPAAGAAPEGAASLFSNGRFESDVKGAGWPDGWPRSKGCTWEKEGDAHFLRLQSAKPGEMVMLFRQAALPAPPPPALEIRLRYRYSGIQPGEKAWFDGRVIGHFKSEGGRTLKPEPRTPAFHGTSKGWVDESYIVKVPAHARTLELMPALFQAAAGTLDVAQCEVFPVPAERLPPWVEVPSATVAPAHPEALPPELRVDGNRLRTKDGKEAWLQGLCVDSLEWTAAGEHLAESLPVAIEQWKANVIRLPMNDAFWTGRGPWQHKDGGEAYRKLVDAAVEAAASRGAYLVLDLHRFGAPMPEHLEFWKDAAVRYKNHPAVLFELFNEPHSVSWKVWRDGGDLTAAENKHADANAAENKEEPTGEWSPGMQAMVDAIRATGAGNVIVAGGLDWGYDLSGVAGAYALQERAGGRGIMYSSHIYPWKKDWQGRVLEAAAKYPVFVGEVGTPPDWKGFQFIPPEQRTESLGTEAWPRDMLGLIQKHKLNWTGFSFHPKCGPCAILDWQYTPTPYWGVYVKQALSGQSFEMKKMR